MLNGFLNPPPAPTPEPTAPDAEQALLDMLDSLDEIERARILKALKQYARDMEKRGARGETQSVMAAIERHMERRANV